MSELPSDSHLLLYLFCAFLEHPKWMLHVDPTSYAGAQSSKNPLFLGVLPPKDRFPEKYIAVISGVPSILHPGACILAVGRQSPPIFASYWDKKLQFSFQVGKYVILQLVTCLSFINKSVCGLFAHMHLWNFLYFVIATNASKSLEKSSPLIGWNTLVILISGKNCIVGFHLAPVPQD